MGKKTLSEEIIGCNKCLGEWIPASKVRKKVLELIEEINTSQNMEGELQAHIVLHTINEKFGPELSQSHRIASKMEDN